MTRTAAARAVYGFASRRPSCEPVSEGTLPRDFDWLCVESDREWTRIPLGDEEGEG